MKLFRIGEVSKIYGISLDTLRHYDHLGILKTIVDENNRYRYYSVEHLDVLEMIILAKHTKTPLKSVSEVLASEDLDTYSDMYQKQQDWIEEEIRLLDRLLDHNEAMMATIDEMKEFKNDYTYTNFIEKDFNLSLYEYDFSDLAAYEFTQKRELYALDQIVSYELIEGVLEKDDHKLALSIPNKNLNAEHRLLVGNFKTIRFVGDEGAIDDYVKGLPSVNKHVFVRYLFAIIKENLNHTYFVEIIID